MIGALGVVFGDIGTSPIYAFRESLKAATGAEAETTVLGVLSLVFWAITLVVAIKYVVVVMRADNQGEGGTMALLSLALPAAGRYRGLVLIVGLAGASLFFGDAMITPAISVLSAVEGMNIVTPLFEPYVVPIASAILFALFALQSHGSGQVGRFFGPVMVFWFGLLQSVLLPFSRMVVDSGGDIDDGSHHHCKSGSDLRGIRTGATSDPVGRPPSVERAANLGRALRTGLCHANQLASRDSRHRSCRRVPQF
jgi:hypothetical protein